jgi:1-deoxy-D-xylulose-5-phosphate reductoisomerase
LVIFGATGSIGMAALNVLRRHRKRFTIVGMAAGSRVHKLAEIAREFGVKNIGIGAEVPPRDVERSFLPGTRFFWGEEGLCGLATLPEADSMLMAIGGTVGLRPTLAAIDGGKTILLASKEILVVAGRFVMERARAKGVPLLPVDSEHNAISQCLWGHDPATVDRLILTASGGPFRSFSPAELENATPAQALLHPTWRMGPKITIDSATMVNKGFEIIEAHWLFGLPGERIDVVVHPESVVHSLVKFCDGSTIAQLGPPNMEFPLANCLFFPERERRDASALDLTALGTLTFAEPDGEKFPALAIARRCLAAGGNACAVFQGANEEAVAAFLKGRIKFPRIGELIRETLAVCGAEEISSVEDCIRSVKRAQNVARDLLAARA